MKLKQTDTFKETYIHSSCGENPWTEHSNTTEWAAFWAKLLHNYKWQSGFKYPQMERRNYGSGPGQYQDGRPRLGKVHWQQQQQNDYPRDTPNMISTQFQPPLPQIMVLIDWSHIKIRQRLLVVLVFLLNLICLTVIMYILLINV